jgi:uncharacterized protein (DUF983 family)
MYGVAGARRCTDNRCGMVLTPESQTNKGQQSLISAAFFGACPSCGERTMFDGPVQFAPKCDACGLDYSTFNVGDGPAAFLTLIIGAIVMVLALVVEFQFAPPLWVHALLWVPITAGLTIVLLRFAKGALLSSEFRRNAHEGQIDPNSDDVQ